jgi:hypothetical protein
MMRSTSDISWAIKDRAVVEASGEVDKWCGLWVRVQIIIGMAFRPHRCPWVMPIPVAASMCHMRALIGPQIENQPLVINSDRISGSSKILLESLRRTFSQRSLCTRS